MFDPRNHAPAPGELAGRVIAITGASSGIGRAVALACARFGATVILIGRNAAQVGGRARRDRSRPAAPEADDRGVGSGEGPGVRLRPARGRGVRTLRPPRRTAAQRRPPRHALAHRALRRADLVPRHARQRDGCIRPDPGADPSAEAIADASVLFTSSSVGRRGRAYWGAYAVSKFATRASCRYWLGSREHQSRPRELAQPRTGAHDDAAPGVPRRRPQHPAAARDADRPYIALLGPASRGVTGQTFDAQPA